MSSNSQDKDRSGGSDPDRTGESRKHRRYSVDVQASVQMTDGSRLDARTRDVSQAGICLIGEQPVAIGSMLHLRMVLTFPNDAYSEPLLLPARVVWCTPIGSQYQVGAMFEDVTEQQDSYLEMFLQFLDGTLTPRGQQPVVEDDERPISPDEKDNPFR